MLEVPNSIGGLAGIRVRRGGHVRADAEGGEELEEDDARIPGSTREEMRKGGEDGGGKGCEGGGGRVL